MSIRSASIAKLPLHGGDLADAAGQSGYAGDWIDLSTGINPTAYPLPDIHADAWTRLPGRRELEALKAAAAQCYGAPSPGHVTASPGSQAILQALPRCLPGAPVTILGPTYTGHASAWNAAQVSTSQAASLDDCDPAGITVVVNPNNPDGRIVDGEALAAFARKATGAGGWLVVDEAFADLDPAITSAPLTARSNVVAVRSFGKFFGLAGLRLGFAISPIALADRLADALGPWAVSGPALHGGREALSDTAWQETQRKALAKAAASLDALLAEHGIDVVGGTSLFRLVSTPAAAELYAHLLKRGIYVRRFEVRTDRLRFGLPGSDAAWQSLETAMAEFKP